MKPQLSEDHPLFELELDLVRAHDRYRRSAENKLARIRRLRSAAIELEFGVGRRRQPDDRRAA